MKEDGSQIIVDSDDQLKMFKSKINDAINSPKVPITYKKYLCGAFDQITKFSRLTMNHINIVYISDFKIRKNQNYDGIESLKQNLKDLQIQSSALIFNTNLNCDLVDMKAVRLVSDSSNTSCFYFQSTENPSH